MGNPIKVVALPAEIGRGLPTVNDHTSGLIPTAVSLRKTADFLNWLAAGRARVLFSRWSHYPYATSGATASLMHSFACRTGPFARQVRITMVLWPSDLTTRSTDVGQAYWTATTQINGTGTTTTGRSTVSSGVANLTTANYASQMWSTEHVFDVLPDMEYRFQLFAVNAVAVISSTAVEVSRGTLDSVTDVGAIDTTAISHLAPITNTTLGSIYDLADKIWRRGMPVFTWSADTPSGVTVASTSYIEVMESGAGSPSTAGSTSGPGFPCQISYAGSLDSSNVGAVFWVAVRLSDASDIVSFQFRDQADNVLAEISNLTGLTTKFYAVSANLTDASGSPETTKISVMAKCTAGGDVALVHGAGVYLHEHDDPRTYEALGSGVPLIGWFDASDPLGDGTTPADGTAISSWYNKAGASYGHAVQATGANQPTYKRNIIHGSPNAGGSNVVRFATNDYLTIANAAAWRADNICIFAVVKASATGTCPFICYPHDSSDTTHRWSFGKVLSGGLDYFEGYINGTAYGGTSSLVGTGWNVVWWSSARNESYRGGRLGYNSPNVGTISYPNSADIHIGATSDLSAFFNGDIAQILVVGGGLNPSTYAARIVRMLGLKTGVPLE